MISVSEGRVLGRQEGPVSSFISVVTLQGDGSEKRESVFPKKNKKQTENRLVKRISLQNRKTVTGHLENGRVVEHLKTRSRRRLASRATAW